MNLKASSMYLRKEVFQTGQTEVRILYQCNQKRIKEDTSTEILHHMY